MKYHEQQALLGLDTNLYIKDIFANEWATAQHNDTVNELVSYIESLDVDWEDSLE